MIQCVSYENYCFEFQAHTSLCPTLKKRKKTLIWIILMDYHPINVYNKTVLSPAHLLSPLPNKTGFFVKIHLLESLKLGFYDLYFSSYLWVIISFGKTNCIKYYIQCVDGFYDGSRLRLFVLSLHLTGL